MSPQATLEGPSYGPASGGAAKHLVILLHGWGADGNDLIGLAPHWAPGLPDAEFLSPHAPFPCDVGFGRQWFSLGDMSPTGDLHPAAMEARLKAVVPMVDAFIDDALEARGLTADKLALVGFSQGTMTALYLGPRRAGCPAAILGYSGRLIGGESLGEDAICKPPMLLIHGEHDEMVPAASLPHAAEQLRTAGFDVTTELRPRLGHAIDPEGLQMGGAFLVKNLLG